MVTSKSIKTEYDKNDYRYLSKLSIVIPTYNRQAFLFRQCTYWSGTGVTLILIDGSPTPLKTSLQKKLEKFQNVTYLHSKTSLGKRLLKASKLITTPFTALCSDDDFITKSGAISSVKLLEKQPDLVACRGESIYASISKDKESVRYIPMRRRFKDFQATQDKIEDRLSYAFSDYNGASSHAIMLTNVWKKSWVEGYSKNYSTSNVSEYYQNIATYICGKVICIPSLQMVHTNENGAIDTPTDNRSLLFTEWLTSDKYKNERANFINDLSSLVLTIGNENQKSPQEIIKETLQIYLKFRLKYSQAIRKEYEYKINEKIVKFVKYFVIRITSFETYIDIKLKLSNYLYTKRLRSLRNICNFSHNYLRELEEIEKIILDFYDPKR